MRDWFRILKTNRFQIYNFEKISKEIEKEEINKFYLKTGAKNFDNVLGKGFHSKTIYLIFGSNKTGKTQLCHQLCIQASKSGYKLMYFDTENTFRPERIKQLATMQNLKLDNVLKNILVSKIMSNNAFILELNNIEDIIKKQNVKVLIIDSINNYYRLEQGDDDISFQKAKSTFLEIIQKLYFLTHNLNLITIATAQITPNFNKETLIKEKPVGTQFLNHYISEFLYLSYKEKDSGYVHLINSLNLPEKKVLYRLTAKGIEDYKI